MKDKLELVSTKSLEKSDVFPDQENLLNFLSEIEPSFGEGFYETVDLVLDSHGRVESVTFIVRSDNYSENHYHYRRGVYSDNFLARLDVSYQSETSEGSVATKVVASLTPDGWVVV
jgi:hypothetical protein